MPSSSTSTARTDAAVGAPEGDYHRTTSEIDATEVSGSHVLTINGYSRAKGLSRNEFISSSFTFAGHSWSIRYYPNGCGTNKEVADYASVYLVAGAPDVMARFSISLFSNSGRPDCSDYMCQFLRMSEPRGFQAFVDRKALELSDCIRNDSFKIRCDITMLKVIKHEVIKYIDVPPSDLVRNLGDRSALERGRCRCHVRGCAGLKKACFDFLMSGNNLLAASIVTGSFEGLTNSCPSILPELLSKLTRKDLEKSAYLFGDSFRVRCDITVITETIVPPARPVIIVPPPDNTIKETKKEEDAPLERFVIVPPPDMHQHLAHLVSSGEGANVTIEVDGETFKAHRSILARSPVFKAELLSPMEEGTSTSCVSIKDIEARIFKAMLHFIYTDSLPDIDEGEAMVMAQKLLAAADRYGLERLKLICEDKLCNYVDTPSVGTILALAEQHGCDGLKKACLKFLMSGSNLKAAIETDGFDHLANSCPSVLKELLAKVVL
ncbi:unnamed protein product [Urochloa decumbens]|uniref:Uncharacterized protein n=1 Tax=Urochloa decumbens TaxID=240449 RepID=A0ABC9B6M4_9POAL